ncbi:MAG: HAD-IIIA family hydrolase, partial [Acidimicrobiales bacterium]
LADGLRDAGAVVTNAARLTKHRERLDFVRDEIRRLGGKAGEDAAEALLAAVGNDLRELAAACSQLVADADGRIDTATVARYYRGRADVSGYTVADAAMVGNLPGALEALRLLAGAGYRVLVVSNQAGIARGEMTEADLAGVTAHMVAEAEAAGGRIDAVYHCPHGWDDGCACRKPAPGMLLAAQRDHHLDLTRALFAGDDDRDAQAAAAAGCPFTQVSEARSLLDVARQLTRDQLQEAVQ